MAVVRTISVPYRKTGPAQEAELRRSLAAVLFGMEGCIGFLFFASPGLGGEDMAVLRTVWRGEEDERACLPRLAEVVRDLFGLPANQPLPTSDLQLTEANLAARCLFEHIDWRVRSFERVLPFYDQFLASLGIYRITSIATDQRWAVYTAAHPWLPGIGQPSPLFALAEEPSHRPSGTRVAFAAGSPAEVEQAAKVARDAGAIDWEPPQYCPEYGPDFYASFFSDPEGNRLEVAYVPERRRPFLASHP